MGERIKKAVTASLPSALRSRESMGVCFLQGLSYSEFLKTQVPGIVPGEIVDARGKTIGRHDGCAFYTIGQKRGLRTDSGEPVVVTGIDAAAEPGDRRSDADLYRRLTVREFCAADPQRRPTRKPYGSKYGAWAATRRVTRASESTGSRCSSNSANRPGPRPRGQPVVSTTATWSSEEASSPTAGGKTLRKSVNPIVPVTFYAAAKPRSEKFLVNLHR